MTTYVVTAPDGKEYEIDTPEGASQEQALSYFKSNWKPKQKAPEITLEQKKQAYREAAQDMPWLQRNAAAMATPFVGAYQSLKELVGKGDPEATAMLKALQEEAPVGMIAGSVAGGIAMPIGAPLTALRAIGQGALMGAGSGMLTPTGKEQATLGDKTTQAATGAAIGAAAGGAFEGVKALYRGVRNIISPAISEKGAQAAAGRLARAIAGKDADTIIDMIKKGDIDETALQAAVKSGSPEFMALGEIVKKRMPKEFDVVAQTQEAARKTRMQGVTPDLERSIQTRTATTTPMYEAATQAGNVVNTAPIANKINDIAKRNPGNPELLRELARIKSGLYDETGKLRADSEQVASVLDGMKTSMANKENKFILENLIEIKDSLSKTIPGYEAAQKKFAELSAPVNQAKVLREMQSVLEKPTGGERVGPFLNVLGRGEQAMLKKTTGFPRFEQGDISKVLTPTQLGAVEKTSGEMLRDIEVDRLAKLGMGKTRKAVGSFEEPIRPVGLLDRAMTITNAVIRRMEGKGGERIEQSLADLMLPQNKRKLAEVMAAATPSERRIIANAIASRSAAIYGGQVGGSVGVTQ